MTPRLSTAINKATWAHRHQTRKGSDLPYILHPYSVMCIAGQSTSDEDTLIACLMHDVIEDVPKEYSAEQMRTDFGDRVLNIVLGVTKNDLLPDWQARADAYLHHLEHEASDESVIVSCADKIHNLMSILADYAEIGEELWDRFNAGKERQIWWYRAILAVVSKRLPELSINHQLKDLVTQLETLEHIPRKDPQTIATKTPDFDAWLMAIGNGEQLGFVRNNTGKSDYIRITIGHTTAKGSSRTGEVLQQLILTTTYQNEHDPVSFGRFTNTRFPGRRIWILFQAVKKQGKDRKVVGHYAGLSPVENKWHKTPGSNQPIEIREVNIAEYKELGGDNLLAE